MMMRMFSLLSDTNPPVRLVCGHAISRDAMKKLLSHSKRYVFYVSKSDYLDFVTLKWTIVGYYATTIEIPAQCSPCNLFRSS